MTKMRSTKGHELTRNVVSVFSCHFVDSIGRQVVSATAESCNLRNLRVKFRK